MQTSAESPAASPSEMMINPFVRVTVRRWIKVYNSGLGLFAVLADIFIRLAIAETFLRSGLVKLADWETAVLLARDEYPVPFLAPEVTAGLGISIEVIGPILLLAGLMTRPAALALGLLTAIAQLLYVPTTTNLFLIALLGWYTLRGASGVSLDRLFANGFSGSAFPFGRWISHIYRFSSNVLAPFWLATIRIWLAITMFAVAGLFEPSIALATWLPVSSVALIPDGWAVIYGILLIVGLASTLVAVLIFFTGVGFAMSGVHPDVLLYPVLLLALYATRGAGPLSLDQLIRRWQENHILFDLHPRRIPAHWPEIVIIGAGFGGLEAANRLKHLPVRVTLIDKRNYHLFQPLLYQIATATLNPSDIAMTIRSMFREDGNVTVIKAEATDIDTEAQQVILRNGRRMPFDKLVVATGARHSYFGQDHWGPFAPGLKSIEDGVSVRRSILDAFERAEISDDPARIRRLLNFVIVGAGPTGVELAGAIAEFSRETLKREYRTFDPAEAQVTLVQSGNRVLPAFIPELSVKAEKSLRRLGVNVRTNSRVTDICNEYVAIGEERIESETVLWAAGVKASPAGRWLDCEVDRSGRVVVDEHLRVPNHANIFVIGDTAHSDAWDGNAVPGLAPAAKQSGTHVAKVVEKELLGRALPKPFRYRHQGSLATIGRRSAVVDFGFLHFSGPAAWWLWGLVHVGFLAGVRNRASVLLSWVWNYFTFQSSARLITERPQSE